LKPVRTKILFVCSRNRRRSLTAETIFKNELVWDVRSAGTEESARIKVTAGHLGWADVIVVMEKNTRKDCGKNTLKNWQGKSVFAFSLLMNMNLWIQVWSSFCSKK
jgi:predicted protein tyrosine phosphatase